MDFFEGKLQRKIIQTVLYPVVDLRKKEDERCISDLQGKRFFKTFNKRK